MAIDWTKLFGDIGAIIARVNSYPPVANTTLANDAATLITQFGTSWLPVEGVAAIYEGFKGSVTSWRQALASLAQRRLSDRATVTDQLGLEQPGVAATLAALYQQFLTEGKALKACTVTLGASTPRPTPANAGSGLVYRTATLDGFNAPGRGMAANAAYSGRPSELCVPSETMTLVCSADSTQDGLPEGSERFSWRGGSPYPALDYRAEGSGEGPTVTCANGAGLIQGGDFTSFSDGTPGGWTLDAGVQGVSATEADSAFRAGAVLLTGGADVRLSQPLSAGLLTGRRMYHLGFAVKATAAGGGGVLLDIGFRADGLPRTALPRVTVPGPSVPTSWTHYGLFLILPSPPPDGLSLVIALDGAPSSFSCAVSSLSLAPVQYHGGVGVAVTAGASPWQRGDLATFTVANDGAGLFQTFFRQFFGVMMPSAVPGTYPYGLLLPLTMMAKAVSESPADSLVV